MHVVKDLKSGLPSGKLTLKLAQSQEEMHEAFRLRYRVFNEELGEGIPENAKTGMDQDYYDQFCDHLLVMDEEQVIGTYRLLPGPRRPKEGFYSETEFDFSPLAQKLDFKQTVELGRACIDPLHRKRATLMSLFWGLHQYTLMQKSRYFIGCGSLPIMSQDDAEATFQSLEHQGRVDMSMGVSPLPENQFQGRADEGQAQVPPLVNFYLEFGAKILGRPAYDPVFKCYDLLVFFDMEDLSQWGIELLQRFDKRLSGGA